jgi:predicted permease
VNPQLNRYDGDRIVALYDELTARFAAVPGVRAIARSHMALLSGGTNTSGIFVSGRTYEDDTSAEIHRLVVSAGFLDTLGIPVLLGRGFTAQDNDSSPKVALINDAAARMYFPDENPVGRRFGSDRGEADEFEIVGVVGDVKYNSVREAAPPTVFVPYGQTRVPTATFVVRTAGDPLGMVDALRNAVRDVDPGLPLTGVATQVERIEGRFSQERLLAEAYSLFGALAALLASIGLFGLMSYSVTRRTNEIGIRMALGAQRREVLTLVMRESMVLVALGVGLGLVVALGASRLVASQLFGLAATDPSTQIAAVVVMVLVSAVAGYLPARRAARVDPLVALKYE